MAGNFTDQLRQKTLSSNDFTNETKKMIDDRFKKCINDHIEAMKHSILNKSSLGKIEIINNKRVINGSSVISFPEFRDEEYKRIENANLSSLLLTNNDIDCEIKKIGGNDFFMILSEMFERTYYYKFTGTFTLNSKLIDFINLIVQEMKKEGIIPTYLIVETKVRPAGSGFCNSPIVITHELTLDKLNSAYSENWSQTSCVVSWAGLSSITLNYYITID